MAFVKYMLSEYWFTDSILLYPEQETNNTYFICPKLLKATLKLFYRKVTQFVSRQNKISNDIFHHKVNVSVFIWIVTVTTLSS